MLAKVNLNELQTCIKPQQIFFPRRLNWVLSSGCPQESR